jgi:hypothetical protein
MKGLDCGTSNFVSAAENSKSEIVYIRERSAYYVLTPKTKIHSKFLKEGLQKSGTKFFEVESGDIIVIGQGAIDEALTREDTVGRPMSRGVVVAKDKDSLPILSQIMKYVLGEPRPKGELVVYSIPASSVDVKFDNVYHTNAMSDELKKLGYTPHPLNESEALCYSNLINDNLTGVCFSFGAGCVNVCLMHNGDPLVMFSTAKSGDAIDEMVAADFDISPTMVQQEKESGINLTAPQTNIQKGIVGRYRVIIKYALENLKFDFENSGHKISVRTPIPLVLSGGTAMVDGFRDIFEEVRAEVGLPFQVSVVRMAKDPLHDVAKGCLLAAKMLY